MSDCDELPPEYPGLSVAEIPELAHRLRQVSIDGINCVRVLRCQSCGQLWEESYRQTGHGEVATTRKLTADPRHE